jgi:hypothetical protein
MDNQNRMNLLNKVAWISIVGFLSYFITTLIFNAKIKNYNDSDRDKPILKRASPYLFWRGDSLDAHFVDAGFMQYYTSKTKHLSKIEAQNTLFECGTSNNKHNFSFKLHPIEIPKSEYEMPEKLLVLSSDVSNLNGLLTFLTQNKVINENYEWTFGNGHLVFVSSPFSVFDNSFFCWLAYKLEQEADKKGGKVHIVLGKNAMERLNKSQRNPHNRNEFFKFKNWYQDTAFDKNAELGGWIHSKNIIEKVGQYLISESGLNKDVKKNIALDSINNFIRLAFNDNKFDEDYGEIIMDTSIQKRILDPSVLNVDYTQFANNTYNLGQIMNGNIRYCKEGKSKEMQEGNKRHNENSDKELESLFKSYKVKHIICRFPDFEGNIETTNNNKYIGEIMDISNRGGSSINTNEIRYKGLWIENNSAYVIDDEGKKTLLFKD